MYTFRKILLLIGCLAITYMTASCGPRQTYSQARAAFKTHITVQARNTDPLPSPPSGFHIVYYNAPLGKFPAIIADPMVKNASGKYPAIVWIAGGFSNSIDDTPWKQASSDNDQSASAFYKNGIITMYPSLRGGNNNPGTVETCYGEVDDVLAAVNYAASLPNVDPSRIYLGGHSTGGTVTLLAAAASANKLRAVFSFGPIDDISHYGKDNAAYNLFDEKEVSLRSPIKWLTDIKSPAYVIEGTGGNIEALRQMKNESDNPNLHFIEVPDRDHFSELYVTTPVVAHKIINDTGSTCNISIEETDWPVH